MREINLIVVHCSATKPAHKATVADIDRWHKERGFAKIGYHYVVYQNGTIHKGRAEGEVGAHVAGRNSTSIGVCYIGGLDANGTAADTRTPEQKASMFYLLQTLRERYPKAAIAGHRDFAPKECPCFDAAAEYKDI